MTRPAPAALAEPRSTGCIAAGLALPHAQPGTFHVARPAIVAPIGAPLAVAISAH